MKNTTSKMKLAVVAALSCACAVAWAENVLYIRDPNPSVKGDSTDWYYTSNYAFADKIDSSVSIAIWAKNRIGPADRDKFLAGVPDQWALLAPAGAPVKLAFFTQSGTLKASNYVLNDGNWHFVVGTFNYDAETPANSFQRLYVDGQLVAEQTTGITAITTPAKMFSLGATSTDMTKTGSFNNTKDSTGYFAELSVWNRALTDVEVSRLYTSNVRIDGKESGLVAYWPLTGALGTVAAAPNIAPTTGVPNLSHYNSANSSFVKDDSLTLPYVRCVASPEWCAANEYEQSENATGRSWDDPLTNLVAVAAAAKSHERILCSPGTHKISSSISPLVANFNLGSCNPATGEPCPETAIIDAQGLCRHFISTSDTTGHQSNFTVENLTFVNGSAGGGGSMYFKSKTGRISNCIFHDNVAAGGSGGAYYADSAYGTVVSNCLFYGNSATNNGGAVCLSHAEGSANFQKFVDCVFTNNTSTASSSKYGGGAVYVDRKIELENCFFADNVATSGQGGHACVGLYSILKGCVFTGTCRANYGTCMAIRKNPVSITNCVFRNLTRSGTSNDFIRFGDSGAGSTIVDCIFTNNTNSTPLFYQNINNLRFRQCLIAGNASGQPVLSNLAGSTVFENCTILQSYFTPAAVSTLTTNTLVNCILPNATITSSGNYCNILSNCLVKVAQNGPYDSGVITGSAGFKDAAQGDYTLKPGSQCREKGLTLGWMTDGSTDLLGNPRVVDRDGNAFTAAALPDLGCYEIQERYLSFMVIVF